MNFHINCQEKLFKTHREKSIRRHSRIWMQTYFSEHKFYEKGHMPK